MKTKHLRSIFAALSLSVLASGGWAADTDFPSRPLKIVVPLGPGGNVDIVARIVAQGLSKELGQAVVVENRAGASSSIGTQFVARSPADGYTMLAIGNTFVSVPALMNAGYDANKEFEGLTQTVKIPMVLEVNKNIPANNVKELLAYLKANPNAATYGTAGAGSTGHFAGELFAAQSGAKLLHVPYKGNAQALADVMGGQVTMMFDQIGSSAGAIKGGAVKALGVTTSTRSAAFPNIPTIKEQGLPDYEDVTFNGLVLPAGTPPAIVNKLFAAVTKVLSDPAVRKDLADKGMDVETSPSPAAYSETLKGESAKYLKLVKERNMSIQ